jgi:hypothetical protein
MKKLSPLLILAFIVVLAFQACKTKKNIVDKNTSNTTNASIAVNDTIFDIPFSETIYHIFSIGDVAKINQESPNKIPLMSDKLYSEADLYLMAKIRYGRKTANEFVSIARKYGKKTTKQKVIDENTQYYLNALNTGEAVFPNIENKDPQFSVKLEKIDNIPSNIQTLFSDYVIFNKVQKNGRRIDKELSTIYNGKLTPLSRLINKVIEENRDKLKLTFEEKTYVLFTLLKGVENEFSIEQIVKVPMKDIRKHTTWNYEVKVILDDKEEKYGLLIQNAQFVTLYLLKDNRMYHICSPYTIY